MPRVLKYNWLVLLAGLCLVGGIRAEAASEDDTSLYWSISGASGHAGYLLGTIHSEDPRVLEFTRPFLDQLSACTVFAMELVPDLPNLSRLQQVMQLPEGQHLSGLLGEPRFQAVVTALAEFGLSREQVDGLKPWAIMLTLSVPRPKTGLFMDFALSLRASGAGVKVVGLESVDEQLSFLEELDFDRQIEMLDHALAEFRAVDAAHDRMVEAYLHGDLDALAQEAREQMESLDPETRQYFLEQGIDARNERMLESARNWLASGPSFIAVGALHLAGERGLVAGLRAAGYRLTALPMPFPAAAEPLDQAAGRNTEARPSATAIASRNRPQAGSTQTTASAGTAQPRLAASRSTP